MPLVGAFSALWQYSSNTDTTVDPGAHQFRLDDITAATALSISTTDDDNGDRHDELAALAVGDHLVLRSTTTSGDYGSYVLVAAPVNHTSWFALAVALSHPPTAPIPGAPPGSERVLLDFVRWTADPTPSPVPGCVPFTPDHACCEEWDTLELALQERATALAWTTLRNLTGGQVGNCPVTVRPCVDRPCDICRNFEWPRPRVENGVWVNASCSPPRCSCAPLCEVVMGGRIAMVEAITVDGAVLDPLAYRVDNAHRIVRQDGGCWPSCQHFDRPAGELGTWSVTYLPGIVPDTAGLWAAGVLACEYAKACSGAKCRLPSSVTSIARQGVSMQMSASLFPNGLVGIREVDAYLAAVNPAGIINPATVWSPDVPWVHHRTQTWPVPT